MYPASASVSGDSSKCLTIRTLMKVTSDELSHALAKYNGNLRISHCRGLGVSRTFQKDEANHKHIWVPRIPTVQWRSVTPNSWAIRSPKAFNSNSLVFAATLFLPKNQDARLFVSTALRKTGRQRTFSWDKHASPLLTTIQLHTCTYQAVGEVSSNIGMASATQRITG